MIIDAFREVLDQKPFHPFRVVLSSGDVYEIRNPHMVALMKSQAFIALPPPGRWAFVPYLYVAAVEALPEENGGGMRGNGSA